MLGRWHARPHVARWWHQRSDPGSIAVAYGPMLDGRDPTEVLVVLLDGRPVGIVQRYLVDDYPAWRAALGLEHAAGIDYYIGEEGLVGRGLGSQMLALAARDAGRRYPQATLVVAAPQQANVASWRALEKAGFERMWAGQLDSDDPDDAGPAFVYGFRT